MEKKRAEIVCVKKSEIIARTTDSVMGYRAYASSGKYIGRVVKIFGPVKRPYIKIKIERPWGRKVGEIYLKRGGRGDRGRRKKR